MISTKIKLFFFILTVLIIALSICLWTIFQKELEISSLEKNRFEFYSLANSKKKNFLDFSTIVNKYVITLESRYEKTLKEFVQITINDKIKNQRNRALKELNFFNKNDINGLSNKEVYKIKGFFSKINFSESMFDKIFKAEDYSYEILLLDIEAINALYGYYKDDNGNFTIKGKPNQQRAKEILYSYKYQILKEEISLNIDEILDYIETFMNEYIEIQKAKEYQLYQLSFLLSFLIVCLILFGIVYSHHRIIKSFKVLIAWTKEVEKGHYIFEKKNLRKDEIGILMHSFNSMAQTIQQNINHLEKISITDSLTKLYNRRALNKTLEGESYKFKRYKHNCSIVLIDIDYFKQVNDTHGHDVGDIILKEFASVLANNIRTSDTLGRWGGEEFLIVCPNTTLDEVRVVAQSLREKIENFNFSTVGQKTASFGTAEFVEGLTTEEVIIKADEALYKAKEQGRNCVV